MRATRGRALSVVVAALLVSVSTRVQIVGFILRAELEQEVRLSGLALFLAQEVRNEVLEDI